MKNLITLAILTVFSYSISAQNTNENDEISLQESLNKALMKNEVKSILDNFQANFNGTQQAIQLKWLKPSNQQVDVYTIEKSTDKNNWQELAKINGMNHNKEAVEYFQTDNQPIAGISYYRLKQVDVEGEEIYSNIVPVKSILSSNEKMNLFPLEESDKKIINISFDNIQNNEQLLVVLRDIKGKEYYSKVLMDLDDNAIVAIPVEANIPKGDYLIIASSHDQMYSQNVTIQ